MKHRSRKHRNSAHRTDLPLLRLAFNEWQIYNTHFYVNLVRSPKKLHFAALSAVPQVNKKQGNLMSQNLCSMSFLIRVKQIFCSTTICSIHCFPVAQVVQWLTILFPLFFIQYVKGIGQDFGNETLYLLPWNQMNSWTPCLCLCIPLNWKYGIMSMTSLGCY
jgi:hypothetical protein